MTGINLIGEKNSEKFPFHFTVGKGIIDKKLMVIKIDYAIPENPFWLRAVLDEIVLIDAEKYLGKVHFRILPGITFSLGYFSLEK